MRTIPLLACILALAVGCGRTPDENLPAAGAPPITGGTLELTEVDGHTLAVASDAARASIYVVDVSDGAERHRIVVPDAEPGRIAVARETAFVVLRGTGEVATVDLRAGEITERRRACSAPRGIDLDPDTGDLWIACAEGVVVRMPPADGGVSQRIPLMSDLRDVVARGDGELWVTRFRAAEVLVVRDGAMVGEPHAIPGLERIDRSDIGFPERAAEFEATVVWRMRDAGNGRVLLVHQLSQSTPIGVGDTGGLGVPTSTPSYGGGGGGGCQIGSGGVVRSAVTFFDGTGFELRQAGSTTLAVDAAVAGRTVALAAASEPPVAADNDRFFEPVNGVRAMPLDGSGSSGFRDPGFEEEDCVSTTQNFDRRRPAVAVAMLPDGRVVAQYRDPGEIVVGRLETFGGFGPDRFFGGGGGGDVNDPDTRIGLSGGSIDNDGHALFHEATPSGAACASCHPEGGDDGHTWRFAFGPRRSQPLRGGILDTAPFHWNGEHRDLAAVFDDTFVQRMGGGTAPAAHEVEAFEGWMDAVPAAPGLALDEERIDRGRLIFRDAGCETCHGRSAVRAGTTAAIVTDWDVPFALRTHEFQAPKLHDMLHRGPYLHDGSAETLEDAVRAMPDAELIGADAMQDLLAYLRSI